MDIIKEESKNNFSKNEEGVPTPKEIYSKHTGKTVNEIKSALERDNFMTGEKAKSFGLIDEVVEKRS